jgi:hypothetical protein
MHRGSRLLAAVAAVMLAASSVGACVTSVSAEARRDCCKKRCHHDAAASLARCCCTDRDANPLPATGSGNVPAPLVPLVVTTPLVLPVPVAVVSDAADLRHPGGPPGFLQRCSLLL